MNVIEFIEQLAKVEERLGRAHKFIQTHTAAGTRDYAPNETVLRQNVLNQIINVFQQHGAEPIDTPVFERKVLLIM